MSGKYKVMVTRKPKPKYKDWSGWTGSFETKVQALKHMIGHFSDDCYRQYTFGIFERSVVGKFKWSLIDSIDNSVFKEIKK